MARRARGIVAEGQGSGKARSESITDGECSTHPPACPKLSLLHFSFTHILVTRVLLCAVVRRLGLGHGFGYNSEAERYTFRFCTLGAISG